jgi:hypothetical protein
MRGMRGASDPPQISKPHRTKVFPAAPWSIVAKCCQIAVLENRITGTCEIRSSDKRLSGT